MIGLPQSPALRSRLLVAARLALSSYWLPTDPASSPALLGAVDGGGRGLTAGFRLGFEVRSHKRVWAEARAVGSART